MYKHYYRKTTNLGNGEKSISYYDDEHAMTMWVFSIIFWPFKMIFKFVVCFLWKWPVKFGLFLSKKLFNKETNIIVLLRYLFNILFPLLFLGIAWGIVTYIGQK